MKAKDITGAGPTDILLCADGNAAPAAVAFYRIGEEDRLGLVLDGIQTRRPCPGGECDCVGRKGE